MRDKTKENRTYTFTSVELDSMSDDLLCHAIKTAINVDLAQVEVDYIRAYAKKRAWEERSPLIMVHCRILDGDERGRLITAM